MLGVGGKQSREPSKNFETSPSLREQRGSCHQSQGSLGNSRPWHRVLTKAAQGCGPWTEGVRPQDMDGMKRMEGHPHPHPMLSPVRRSLSPNCAGEWTPDNLPGG